MLILTLQVLAVIITKINKTFMNVAKITLKKLGEKIKQKRISNEILFEFLFLL